MAKAGLPRTGECPFRPSLAKNQRGELMLKKQSIRHGPKKGKRGYVDDQGRIWVKDYAHAGVPDHWDVQEEGDASYMRVDFDGNEIP
jgi:hypothetical protein